MPENKNSCTLHTSLNLPVDIAKKIITIQMEKRVSVSSLATTAVIKYIGSLPEEEKGFCDECQEFLPVSEFYLKNGKPFRLCKEHHKARSVRWRQEHRAYWNERQRHWYRLKKATA